MTHSLDTSSHDIFLSHNLATPSPYPPPTLSFDTDDQHPGCIVLREQALQNDLRLSEILAALSIRFVVVSYCFSFFVISHQSIYPYQFTYQLINVPSHINTWNKKTLTPHTPANTPISMSIHPHPLVNNVAPNYGLLRKYQNQHTPRSAVSVRGRDSTVREVPQVITTT